MTPMHPTQITTVLHDEVTKAVEHYLAHLNGENNANIYEIFLHEFEKHLLMTVMNPTFNSVLSTLAT